ncbi:MAG: lipoyl protein ligase domain-containing protein [Pirellulales bacterium]
MRTPSDARPPLPSTAAHEPLAVWLAGSLRRADHLAMNERLAGEMAAATGRLPTLVIAEVEPCITIGRSGSRSDVRMSDDDLAARRLEVSFVGRGGGAVVHGPGQVVISLVASLEDLGLGPHDVGGYLGRLQAAVAAAMRAVRCGSAVVWPGMHGVFGRTGLLAAVGVAVRRGVVSHGAFVNVSPPLDLAHRVDTMPVRLRSDAHEPVPTTMGSIEADVQRRVRLQDVRTAVVQAVTDAFGFPRIHVNAGVPFPIRPAAANPPEIVTRVG